MGATGCNGKNAGNAFAAAVCGVPMRSAAIRCDLLKTRTNVLFSDVLASE
jgi:hypothetical protein